MTKCVLADDVSLNRNLGNFFLTFVVITTEHKLLQPWHLNSPTQIFKKLL